MMIDDGYQLTKHCTRATLRTQEENEFGGITSRYCEGRVLKKNCDIVCLKGHMQWNLLAFFFACPDIVSTTVVLRAVLVRIAVMTAQGHLLCVIFTAP